MTGTERQEKIQKIMSGYGQTENDGLRAIQEFIGQGKPIPPPDAAPASPVPADAPTPAPFPARITLAEEDPHDVYAAAGKIERAIEQLDAAPEMTYEQKLAQYGLDTDSAARIVDDLMTQGYHEHTYPITRTKTAVFRTRTAEDVERAFAELEREKPQFALSISNQMAGFNLSVSLVELGGKDYRALTPEARRALFRKLPRELFGLLVGKLNKFDNMITDVMDEGAIQNF